MWGDRLQAPLMSGMTKLGLATVVFCVTAMAQAATQRLTYHEQVLVLDGTRHSVQVPDGFELELLTAELDGLRLLTFSADGDLFIGSKSGRIYRLPPAYTSPTVLVTLDDYSHSVAFRKDEIRIARTDGLYRAPYPLDARRGGIMVLHEEGGKATWRPYATGLRNPVGFAWQPHSGMLYASNNGPDHWGFDLPPKYFSRITAGSFHGMPWFQYASHRLQGDKCIKSAPPRPLREVTMPVATYPTRNAPMGVTFAPGGALSKILEGDAIVALHGSWATRPSGGFFGDSATRRPPKFVTVRFKDGRHSASMT